MLIFICSLLIASLQEPVEIPFFKEAPVIDGIISEGEWTDAHIFSGYYIQTAPDFGKKIDENTIVNIGYDKNSLHVLFEVYQDTSTLIKRKGTRDNAWHQDGVGIYIDPLGTKQEMFLIVFGFSGTICDFRKFRASTSGEADFTWDADVNFETSKTDFGYIVEVEIPFANFRRSGEEEVIWNINLFRRIEHKNSQATYEPRKDISNEAKYECLMPIKLKGIGEKEKIEITPYGIYGSTFDSLTTKQGDAGFDMKVPLGATSVANFAFNPDFSQLEGDPLEFDFFNQYALYFEEYRPFFIEERGVFQTDHDLYYSRTIQNPFLAARYTYKDPQNQAGIIFAYDEEDTIIENTEAVASILRYTRQYGKNNAGVMILDRHDLTDDYNNLIFMTDGNTYLPFNIKLTYQLAGTSVIDSSSNEVFSDIGFYHHGFLAYVTNSWVILGNFLGRSPDMVNDLGYLPEVDENYAGGYIAKRFQFNGKIVKSMEIGENFGFSGPWSRFDDYIKSARDSIEYFAMTELFINLFTNTFALARYRIQKTFWEDNYLERWAYNLYCESKINEYVYVEGGFNGGYLIDFNIAAVGKYNSGWARIFYSPFPVLSINGCGVFNIYDTDTTRQVLRPSDVDDPVYTWRTHSVDAGINYSPTNNLSLKLVAERQIANFTEWYVKEEDEGSETEVIDDKIFCVIEYKPSIGNVIYLGGRYPEKMLFFKFTHRFML